MMHRDKLEKERIIKRNEKHVKNVVVDNLIVDKRFNNDGNYNIYVDMYKEVEKTNRLQQMPFKSEKNKSKCSHDIINHQYINYEESMKMERKKNVRKEILYNTKK
ncbi:hypothetical protein PFNF54_03583 [Plasmodium falciparum NF54]|uniref:Uncharacterized protein n=1 Tax=Plasmodium falciparum (isolate NF54) TaxID=5843 RepID=W7JR76_PLAFO|nr:hypothetical protein PFNF54_03583 [Plasmodium falciparum NF54]